METFNKTGFNETKKLCVLSGNALKLIAAVAMLCDHIGIFFFPKTEILRIIGRLAFPIFAFMIAEGCRYTKNKLRYFLTVFLFAAVCQTVYFLYDGSLEMCIFVTFSLSMIMVYALQHFRETLFSPQASLVQKLIAATLFSASVAAVYILNIYLDIDYGFYGCMLPVLASIFRKPSKNSPPILERLDILPVHVLMLGVGLILLSMNSGSTQYFSLLSLPLLLLYSGKRGKWKSKYFFYVFYPAHLAILEGINMLLK